MLHELACSNIMRETSEKTQSKEKSTIRLTKKISTQSSGQDFSDEFVKILPTNLVASSYQFHEHISQKKC